MKVFIASGVNMPDDQNLVFCVMTDEEVRKADWGKPDVDIPNRALSALIEAIRRTGD